MEVCPEYLKSTLGKRLLLIHTMTGFLKEIRVTKITS